MSKNKINISSILLKSTNLKSTETVDKKQKKTFIRKKNPMLDINSLIFNVFF